MEKQVTTHIVKGLILGGISVLSAVVIHIFNLYENAYSSLITYGVFFIGIIYSCLLFANQNDNKIPFGNIFAHGFKTTSVVIVVAVVYTVIAIKFLFPEIIDISINLSRKQMLAQSVKNPKLTSAMIEESIKMTREKFIPFAIGGTVISNGFIGLIASLIGAAVSKKNTNPFENKSTI